VKENSKKVLTKREESGRIVKLSKNSKEKRNRREMSESKKAEKNF